MRWVALAVLVGCVAQPLPPSALPELVPPGDHMQPDAFDERTASLRATLARSHVGFDVTPAVKACGLHHGVDDCVTCEVANRNDTRGIDADMIDAVAIAFARYPTSVLTSAHLEHVALCRKIRYDHPHGPEPAGLAITDDNRLMISIETFWGDFTLDQIVHHELFHLIDHAMLGPKAYDDHDWHALNPPAFAYSDPAPQNIDRPAGFVNSYATTNELEDRASVFEFIMGQPQALCEITGVDPIVAAKVKMVRARVASVMGARRLPPERCPEKAPPAVKSPIPLHPRPPSLLRKMR